jgi:hypothetical protein
MHPAETQEPEIVESLDIGVRRRRSVAPGVAAAGVAVLAATVVVLALRGPDSPSRAGVGGPLGTLQPGSTGATEPVATQSSAASDDPKAAALAEIAAALEGAPLPPDAVRSDSPLPPLDDGFVTSASPNEVRTSRFYTAPGTVSEAFDYVKGHPPTDMSMQSYGSGPQEQDIEFATAPTDPASYPVELDYYLVPYRSGIALRVDAWTTWAPNRPPWSLIPADATSVDLTVVRDAYNDQPAGAPTVQRTLTGDALAKLAATLNALPARAPEGVHSCPAMLMRASELAVFHTPDGDIRVSHPMDNCSFNAIITAPPSKDEVYVGGNDVTAAVLAALGLPADYGYPSR